MDKNFENYLFEEENFLNDKKKYKKIRKLKSSKDKSKYKKTDQKTKNIELSKKNSSKSHKKLQKALVLSIFGNDILIDLNNKQYICPIKGILKKEKTRNKNILAVGDIVNVSFENQNPSIESIDKRFSILSRIDERTQKRSFIAVNISQVIITASILKPKFKPHLIDRYIIATLKENMIPIIVINKIDLLNIDPLEKKKYLNFLKIYKNLGYEIISISCLEKKGLKKLKNKMKNQTSVFSGQSGTGKSSIINEILKTNLKIGQIQKKSLKGSHTTSKTSLIPISQNSFCIDTPGIKSFGIWDLNIQDIKNHFFEIDKISKNCKYPNCLHINEPDCEVIKALKEDKISSLRFESYRSLIEEITKK